jgi:hypothetical protein
MVPSVVKSMPSQLVNSEKDFLSVPKLSPQIEWKFFWHEVSRFFLCWTPGTQVMTKWWGSNFVMTCILPVVDECIFWNNKGKTSNGLSFFSSLVSVEQHDVHQWGKWPRQKLINSEMDFFKGPKMPCPKMSSHLAEAWAEKFLKDALWTTVWVDEEKRCQDMHSVTVIDEEYPREEWRKKHVKENFFWVTKQDTPRCQ